MRGEDGGQGRVPTPVSRFVCRRRCGRAVHDAGRDRRCPARVLLLAFACWQATAEAAALPRPLCLFFFSLFCSSQPVSSAILTASPRCAAQPNGHDRRVHHGRRPDGFPLSVLPVPFYPTATTRACVAESTRSKQAERATPPTLSTRPTAPPSGGGRGAPVRASPLPVATGRRGRQAGGQRGMARGQMGTPRGSPAPPTRISHATGPPATPSATRRGEGQPRAGREPTRKKRRDGRRRRHG